MSKNLPTSVLPKAHSPEDLKLLLAKEFLRFFIFTFPVSNEKKLFGSSLILVQKPFG